MKNRKYFRINEIWQCNCCGLILATESACTKHWNTSCKDKKEGLWYYNFKMNNKRNVYNTLKV